MKYEPVGMSLNNPAHIRLSDQRWIDASETQEHNDFVKFDSAEGGIRAICEILIAYQDVSRIGCDLSAIKGADRLSDWISNSDIARLLKRCTMGVLDVYNPHVMLGLIEQIITLEFGMQPFGIEQIKAGMLLAGIRFDDSVKQAKEPIPEAIHQEQQAKKKVTQSKTMIAGAGSILSLSTVPVIIEEVKQSKEHFAAFDLPYIEYVPVGICLLLVVYMMIERIKKLKKGI